MRIVQFFDGAQSETTPTIGNIKASGLIEYADDAAYEASEQGSPAEGNIYFNTTSNLIRYYNGTSWIDVVDRETAQSIDNKTIDGGSGGTNTVLTVADNVEVTPVGNLESTNTQAALEELQGDVDALDSRLDTAESDIVDLQTNKENKSEKGIPNGYAPLDALNLIPAIHIPGFTDDVLEFANVAAFPVTGETGKIYIAIDTNFQYRWTGSIYVQLSNSPVNTVNGQTGIVVLDLDDINDVNAPTPSNGDVLTFNGTEWTNQVPSSSVSDLDDLTDVVITSPINRQILRYNGTNWVNATNNTPTIQTFLTGSGTYTTPTSPAPLYIKVKMVGGGGGGSGSGTAGGGSGGAGGSTTFGSSLLTATGGSGGIFNSTLGGTGGSSSISPGPIGLNLTGGDGNGGAYYPGNLNASGGLGGSSAFGGAGRGGWAAAAGNAGKTNSGSGGGGGGMSNAANGISGGGGGAGGFIEAIINSPSASYAYSVGTGGTAGTAGTSGFAGGAGGSGVIIVTEYYQ